MRSEMKSFESRMRELVHTEMTSESPDWNGGSLQVTETTIPMHSVADALAIAQEADHAVSELRVALESFADFVARHMPSNGYDATMVRTELVAVREYLGRTK